MIQAAHSRDFSRELASFYLSFLWNIWYNMFMDKEPITSKNNRLTYGRGYVYSIQYHIVWCTKYRRKILKDGVDDDLKGCLYRMAEDYGFGIIEMEVMPDHIHLLLDCRPQFFPSDMVKILKGNCARWLFLEHPELKESLWGGHLWNPSYCIVTVSDRSFEMVREYIASQKQG